MNTDGTLQNYNLPPDFNSIAALSSLRNIVKMVIEEKTSDVGSPYRCGPVGRGSQPPSTPNTPPNTLSKQTHTQKASKRSFFHFSIRAHGRTDQRTDGRTDGWTKPFIELCVRK